jgi:hypothetical protein
MSKTSRCTRIMNNYMTAIQFKLIVVTNIDYFLHSWAGLSTRCYMWRTSRCMKSIINNTVTTTSRVVWLGDTID